MSSFMSRSSFLSRSSANRTINEEDIELGDWNVQHHHESTAPLIGDLRESFGDLDDLPSSSKSGKKPLRKLARQKTRRCPSVLTEKVRWLCTHILILLGCYQSLLILWSLLDGLCPDDAKFVRAAFGLDNRFHKDTYSSPDAVTPISCHSHNDYWRVRPFHTAIEMGCSSVEADVWLINGDLLVGHTRSSLSRNRTLQNMYLDPILETLDDRNTKLQEGEVVDSDRIGIFLSEPGQTLVLLVDFKLDGPAIWPVLQAQLEPLRQKRYLTYFDGLSVIPGPITIVASGDVSFEDIVRNTTYRDVFYDAPLDVMGKKTHALLDLDYEKYTHISEQSINGEREEQKEYDDNDNDNNKNSQSSNSIHRRSRIPTNPSIYSPINSYYASVSFTLSIGRPFHSSLSHTQLNLIRSQVRGAHARGLKVRYWGAPTWPIGVRNYLWRVLVREGVDVLSVDDVEAVTRGNWGPRKGGWERKWWP